MKKLLLTIMIVLSIICLTGCDNSAEENYNKAKEQELKDAEEQEKNVCTESNISVTYNHFGDKINFTLTNINSCTWQIKTYSQVSVLFTDGSHKNVSLGTAIDLKSGANYTFKDCFLGSQHKDKTVKSVKFVD